MSKRRIKEENVKKNCFYYENELKDDVIPKIEREVKIDGNYKYIHNNIIWKICEFIVYRIFLTPIAFLYCKIKWNLKVIGKKKLKKYQKEGYFLYGNHSQEIGDAFIPTIVNFPKKTYVLIHPDNLAIPIMGKINKMVGGIPIPGDYKSAKNFLKTIKLRIQENSVITIYPEAHVWPYYTKIRNYSEETFKYPVNLNRPTFCMTTIYKKGKSKPKIEVYIDGPFWPDKNLEYRKNQIELRNKVYECMKKRAKQNEIEYIKYIKKEEK